MSHDARGRGLRAGGAASLVRRLAAERFALVFAVRESSAVQELDGLPELVVEGLGEGAEDLYREAIEQLGRSRVVVHHARAQLVYGEWLRREHRRVDARGQLKAAYAAFDAMGAKAFAERAQRELLATGETVRKRTADTNDALTSQEAQIARLAYEGLINPEIGHQLFLSHRTVEWHLRKVFTKLGISSRRELTNALRNLNSELAPL